MTITLGKDYVDAMSRYHRDSIYHLEKQKSRSLLSRNSSTSGIKIRDDIGLIEAIDIAEKELYADD